MRYYRLYLKDILAAIERTEEFVQDMSLRPHRSSLKIFGVVLDRI